MTILSTVCTKLLCTNAHLGRRVAAHHLKVYTRGSRNGIAILDSDKILICLRSALHFIGSLIRKKGHSFFLKTNHLFILLIMEKMIYSIMEKMGSCINDSQWKIGAFLTNSFANPKKFRSRKKKIHFGLNQQPDCVVIPNPDRKSSVILEANRSQIPIASLLDSTIPWESYKRITYPIPANDTIQFIYLFRHSITKTVILSRQSAMNTRTGTRAFSKGRLLGQQLRTYSASSHSSLRKKKKCFFFLGIGVLIVIACWLFPDFIPLLKEQLCSVSYAHLTEVFSDLAGALAQGLASLFQFIFETVKGGNCAPLGIGTEKESTSSPGEEKNQKEQTSVLKMDNDDWRALSPILEVPPTPGSSSEGSRDDHQNLVPAAPPAPPAAPIPPAPQEPAPPAAPIPPAPQEPAPPAAPVPPGALPPLSAKDMICFNLTILYGSLRPGEEIDLANEIYSKKESILEELRRLTGPINGQILWQNDTSGSTIRTQKGMEYSPNMLSMIQESLQREGPNSPFFKRFLNDRMDTLKKAELRSLKLEDLPTEKLDELNQVKLLTDVKWRREEDEDRIKKELRKQP